MPRIDLPASELRAYAPVMGGQVFQEVEQLTRLASIGLAS
jgi:hypothetical protein